MEGNGGERVVIDPQLLVAMWTSRLFERLLLQTKTAPKDDTDTDTSIVFSRSFSTSNKDSDRELQATILRSIVGEPLWDNNVFYCNKSGPLQLPGTTGQGLNGLQLPSPLPRVEDVAIPVTCVECIGNLNQEKFPSGDENENAVVNSTATENKVDPETTLLELPSAAQLIPDSVVSANDANTTTTAAASRPRRVSSQSSGLTGGRMSLTQMHHELSKPNLHQHYLVVPQLYDISVAGVGLQPFEIKVHPQVSLITDLHGHLCEAEVIGLLAGRWDPALKCMYVQAPFPCTATDREGDDDGSTDVELDPVAELQVREVIHGLGLQVVGWYHSHPRFRPDPSVTDIHNQQQYQRLMRDDATGMEPFVGLIVSTYDTALPTPVSHHQWFNTLAYRPTPAPSQSQSNGLDPQSQLQTETQTSRSLRSPVVQIPMALDVQYLSHRNLSQYINSRALDCSQTTTLLSALAQLRDGNDVVTTSANEPTVGNNNSTATISIVNPEIAFSIDAETAEMVADVNSKSSNKIKAKGKTAALSTILESSEVRSAGRNVLSKKFGTVEGVDNDDGHNVNKKRSSNKTISTDATDAEAVVAKAPIANKSKARRKGKYADVASEPTAAAAPLKQSKETASCKVTEIVYSMELETGDKKCKAIAMSHPADAIVSNTTTQRKRRSEKGDNKGAAMLVDALSEGGSLNAPAPAPIKRQRSAAKEKANKVAQLKTDDFDKIAVAHELAVPTAVACADNSSTSGSNQLGYSSTLKTHKFSSVITDADEVIIPGIAEASVSQKTAILAQVVGSGELADHDTNYQQEQPQNVMDIAEENSINNAGDLLAASYSDNSTFISKGVCSDSARGDVAFLLHGRGGSDYLLPSKLDRDGNDNGNDGNVYQQVPSQGEPLPTAAVDVISSPLEHDHADELLEVGGGPSSGLIDDGNAKVCRKSERISKPRNYFAPAANDIDIKRGTVQRLSVKKQFQQVPDQSFAINEATVQGSQKPQSKKRKTSVVSLLGTEELANSKKRHILVPEPQPTENVVKSESEIVSKSALLSGKNAKQPKRPTTKTNNISMSALLMTYKTAKQVSSNALPILSTTEKDAPANATNERGTVKQGNTTTTTKNASKSKQRHSANITPIEPSAPQGNQTNSNGKTKNVDMHTQQSHGTSTRNGTYQGKQKPLPDSPILGLTTSRRRRQRSEDGQSKPKPVTVTYSILGLLQSPREANVRGRQMICEANEVLRPIALAVVTLGFYYSKHPRRTGFNKKWKSISKIDKLGESCKYWIQKIGCWSEADQVSFASAITDFLKLCWKD